jgi:hypothetical protein
LRETHTARHVWDGANIAEEILDKTANGVTSKLVTPKKRFAFFLVIWYIRGVSLLRSKGATNTTIGQRKCRD